MNSKNGDGKERNAPPPYPGDTQTGGEKKDEKRNTTPVVESSDNFTNVQRNPMLLAELKETLGARSKADESVSSPKTEEDIQTKDKRKAGLKGLSISIPSPESFSVASAIRKTLNFRRSPINAPRSAPLVSEPGSKAKYSPLSAILRDTKRADSAGEKPKSLPHITGEQTYSPTHTNLPTPVSTKHKYQTLTPVRVKNKRTPFPKEEKGRHVSTFVRGLPMEFEADELSLTSPYEEVGESEVDLSTTALIESSSPLNDVSVSPPPINRSNIFRNVQDGVISKTGQQIQLSSAALLTIKESENEDILSPLPSMRDKMTLDGPQQREEVDPASIPLPVTPISSTQITFPKRHSQDIGRRKPSFQAENDVIEVVGDPNSEKGSPPKLNIDVNQNKKRGLYETRKLSMIPKSANMNNPLPSKTQQLGSAGSFSKKNPFRKYSLDPNQALRRPSLSAFSAVSFNFVNNTTSTPFDFIPIPINSKPRVRKKYIIRKERRRFRYLVSFGKNSGNFFIESPSERSTPTSMREHGLMSAATHSGSAHSHLYNLLDVIILLVPGFIVDYIKATYPAPIRYAWIHKVSITSSTFLVWALSIYVLFLMSISCPATRTWPYKDIVQFTYATKPYAAMVYGKLYNFSDPLMLHKNKVYVNTTNQTIIDRIIRVTGQDVSTLFLPYSEVCTLITVNGIPKKNCTIPSLPDSPFCHTDLDLLDPDVYLKPYLMGPVSFSWDEVLGHPTRVVYSGHVLDLGFYLKTNISFLGEEFDIILRESVGTDITRKLTHLGGLVPCLVNLYKVGIIDENTPSCLAVDIIFGILSAVSYTFSISTFAMALGYSWWVSRDLKRITLNRTFTSVPDLGAAHRANTSTVAVEENTYDPKRDVNIVMLVTCYNEDTAHLKMTLDSLAATTYSDKQKMILLVFDGSPMANQITYTKIILESIELHPQSSPHPHPVYCASIGEDAKKSNMAYVYAGTYVKNNHRVPIIAVFKCGNSDEQADGEPGHRGKRDSQLLIINFFHKVLFNAPMTPLEYDVFRKIVLLTGMTPDKFEAVLMADVKTEVLPESLARMVSYFIKDDQIIGVGAETVYQDSLTTWKRAIQMFEEILEFHYHGLVSSIWGVVSSISPHFFLHRIKIPPKNSEDEPMPIICHPYIIEEYSQYQGNTLHQQNLLNVESEFFLATLLHRCFPKHKLVIAPTAQCRFQKPEIRQDFFTQFKNHYNAKIHNLYETMFFYHLKGAFCVSPQFLYLLEWLSTILKPIPIISLWYTYY
jgi:chitin synthase